MREVLSASASADREELIVADVSREVLDGVRARMAVLTHRRPDLYG